MLANMGDDPANFLRAAKYDFIWRGRGQNGSCTRTKLDQNANILLIDSIKVEAVRYWPTLFPKRIDRLNSYLDPDPFR